MYIWIGKIVYLMGNVGALHTIKYNTIWPNACYKTVNKQKIILLSGVKKGFHRGTKSYSIYLKNPVLAGQLFCYESQQLQKI